MGITEPEEPTSQKKIYFSEISLDCANVYRSQEPSILDYSTWPLQLAGTSSDEKDHAVPSSSAEGLWNGMWMRRT